MNPINAFRATRFGWFSNRPRYHQATTSPQIQFALKLFCYAAPFWPLECFHQCMRDFTFRDALGSDDLVRMRLLDDDSNGRCDVKIARISVDRIELISPISVFPGTLVQLQYEGAFLLAEARCCYAVGSAFRIGVEVQDAFLTQAAGSFHPASESRTITLDS